MRTQLPLAFTPGLPDNADYLDKGAVMSPCQRYRYKLWRLWDEGKPMCAFLMLNPSVADAVVTDRTVAKCTRLARAWGYGYLMVVNLFAFRATSPLDMRRETDPVGPDNDRAIVDVTNWCNRVVVAWGNHGAHEDRGAAVLRMLGDREVYYLALNKSGHPVHPLYQRDNVVPTAISARDLFRRIVESAEDGGSL